MQTTSAAFTAEEKDTVRKIVQNLQISWKRQTTLGNRTFTIAVSLIGGNDIIGINPGAVGSPGIYKYFDETAYATSLNWERGYSMPQGGLSMALAEANLDNTSGRFLPRYMGGNSELFTAILPSRPVKISAGFNFNGVDNLLPQFAGVVTGQPRVDARNKEVRLKMADYVNFFQNKYLDKAAIFTAQRTDQVLQTLFSQLGMSTAQYDLDYGINIIPFGVFDAGTRFSDAISALVEAENGHLYQDESGIFKFENRQHWDASPYNTVQKIISTNMVINAEAPDDSHLINVVEVRSTVRTKQPDQLLFTLSSPYLLAANTVTDLYVNFDDPILALDTPSAWIANTSSNGTGINATSSVSLRNIDTFAQAARLTFTNTNAAPVYLTSLTLYGRPAKVTSEVYYRAQDGSSITAYNEQPLSIENNFIQSQSWAQSYAQMMLNDFSNVEKLQKITVRAMPDLQLGDLISWQGRYWRVFDIKNTLDPSQGFVQELLLLQRTITTYFRIGISTIGGKDQIAP
jgi:hypothetical protein